MSKFNTYLKYLLKNSLIKNASFLIGGSLIVSVVNFIFVIVATRLFEAEQVGLATAAISAVWIISTISEFGLGITLIRFLPEAGQNENGLINFLLTGNFLLALLVTAIFILGMPAWAPALLPIRQNLFLIVVFLIFALSASLQPVLLNIFLAKRQSSYMMQVNGITSGLKIVVLVLLAWWFKNTFDILLAAALASFIGILLLLLYFVPRVIEKYRFSPVLKHGGFKELISYALGNYIGRLFLQITPFILPLIVVHTLGTNANAVFFVAWSVFAIIQVIPSAIFNSLFAEAANKSASLKVLVKDGTKFLFYLVIPVIIVMVIAARPFLLIFGNEYSVQGTTLLRIMVWAAIPWGINYCYISIARFQKQTFWLVTVALVSLLISLLLSYFFMKIWGINGAGAGYLAGQSIIMIFTLILIYRALKKETADATGKECYHA